MRTTIDLPDGLFKQAKMKALEEGLTLKEFFIKALNKELRQDSDENYSPWKELNGKGISATLDASESGFTEYEGPDIFPGMQVNESPE